MPAITPKEALGDKIEKEAKIIEETEKFFNEQLAEKYDGTGPVTLDRPKVSKYVMDIMAMRYHNAGWNLKLWQDGRNEDHVIFEPYEYPKRPQVSGN